MRNYILLFLIQDIIAKKISIEGEISLSLDYLNELKMTNPQLQNWANISTIMGAGLGIITLALLLFQLRKTVRLARSTFIAQLNKDLAEFSIVRAFLKQNITLAEFNRDRENLLTEQRIEDYFTSFENIRWLIKNKTLKKKEAKEYFGSRFKEAYNSDYRKSCWNFPQVPDQESFQQRHKLMNELAIFMKVGEVNQERKMGAS